MKKITTHFKIVTGIICLFYGSLKAQQSPVFSEYNYNPMLINSAFTGFDSDTEISISNTGFFNNFDGSPKALQFTLQTTVDNDKMGLGAGFSKDEIGVTSVNTIFANYSYKIFFDIQSNRPDYQHYVPTVLAFGVTAGLQIYDDNLLSLGIEDDPNFAENIHANIPTFGFGVVFNNDRFYAGVSSPNLLGTKLANEVNLELSNVYFGYLGYRIFTDQFREVLIKPNVLLKYENGAPFQADINTAVNYKNKFEIGAGYRTTSSMNFLVGFYMLKHLRLIYQYNQPFRNNPIQNSHGISLSFRFGNGYGE